MLDPADTADELKQAKKRKLKKVVENTPSSSKNIGKGEISQWMKLFINVAKSLIDSRMRSRTTAKP